MGVVPEIQKAFEMANQANLTREELENLEQTVNTGYMSSGRRLQGL